MKIIEAINNPTDTASNDQTNYAFNFEKRLNPTADYCEL